MRNTHLPPSWDRSQTSILFPGERRDLGTPTLLLSEDVEMKPSLPTAALQFLIFGDLLFRGRS